VVGVDAEAVQRVVEVVVEVDRTGVVRFAFEDVLRFGGECFGFLVVD